MLGLTAKKSNSIKPTVSFSVFADSINSVLTMGTYHQYKLIDNSKNVDSYSWNLDNDSTSNQKTPVLFYPKSGNNVITLTVQNADGQKSTITKNVTPPIFFVPENESLCGNRVSYIQ